MLYTVSCKWFIWFDPLIRWGAARTLRKIGSFSVSCQKIPKKSELATLNIRRNYFNPNLKSILVCGVRKYTSSITELCCTIIRDWKGKDQSFFRLVDCNYLIGILILFVFLWRMFHLLFYSLVVHPITENRMRL